MTNSKKTDLLYLIDGSGYIFRAFYALFSFIREAVKAFNLPSIEMENYEADDLIATYKKEALKKNIRVKIISSDKDLMQLIDDQTTLFDSMKNKDIGIEEVKEKFGS